MDPTVSRSRETSISSSVSDAISFSTFLISVESLLDQAMKSYWLAYQMHHVVGFGHLPEQDLEMYSSEKETWWRLGDGLVKSPKLLCQVTLCYITNRLNYLDIWKALLQKSVDGLLPGVPLHTDHQIKIHLLVWMRKKRQHFAQDNICKTLENMMSNKG